MKANFVIDYLPNGVLSVTFPYDATSVQLIRAMPGRQWHKERKFWSIPRTSLGTLQQQAARLGIGVALSDKVRQALNLGRQEQKALMAAKRDETPLDLPTSTQPMPFQYAGVRFAKYALHNFKGALIADSMGLGKTFQALSVVALHDKLQSVLVLCPATLKYTWAAEVEKHYPQLSYTVIDGPANKRRELWAAESRLKIANYEILLRDLEPRIVTWDLVVADECLAPESLVETEMGPMPIKDIVNNRLSIPVWSYNHETNNLELKKVINWSAKPQYLPLVNFGGLRLTENHNIISRTGKVSAKIALQQAPLYTIFRLKPYGLSRNSLPRMWRSENSRLSLQGTTLSFLRKTLFGHLADATRRSSQQSIYPRTKQEELCIPKKNFPGRSYNSSASSGKDSRDFERSFSANLGRQRHSSTYRSEAEKFQTWILGTRRQWPTPFLETRKASGSTGLVERICCKDEQTLALANQLQDRYSRTRSKNSYRSRQLAKPEENRMVQGEWVDASTFLQQNGGDLDGGMSSDGYVYNITVEGNHNYIAGGILVANCGAFLKSYKAQRTKRTKKLRRRYSLGLSGIPLENRLEELHSVMDFVIPGLLGPGWLFVQQHVVKNDWGVTVGYHGLEQVRERIAPYYIRRRKADVLQELPDKVYNDVHIEMSGDEWELYDSIRKQIKEKIAGNPKLTVANILVEVLRLKQATCDARLLDVEGIPSSKMETVRNILAAAGDHKVVFFTFFAQLAWLMGEELEAPVIAGGVPAIERQRIIDEFQAGQHPCLVSTDAGAYGITLTAADIVVHVDPCWTPARMRQREDRLHRIGQKNSVQVVNLICRRTVDEKVRKILHNKLQLIKAVLDEDAPEEDAIRLSKEDIMGLLGD